MITAAATEQEWFAAVAARDEHDAEAATYWSRTTCGERAAAHVRRSQGAKRAGLTRRIIRAEKAIDADKGN